MSQQQAKEVEDDANLISRIEARLSQVSSRRLRGSSDSSFWSSPSALWRDETYRGTWYTHAKRFWDDAVVAPPTLNGVLGGFSALDGPDRKFSSAFLREAINPVFGFVAADVGAGIGRVVKHVLLPLGAGRVDLVEQSVPLLRAAPEFITTRDEFGAGGEDECARCRFVCAAMQSWQGKRNVYDVIWAQWSIAHLTDADFVAFLRRSRYALKAGGILVIKDNVLHTNDTDDLFYVDEDDRSMCRSYAYFRALFDEADAVIHLERQQPVQRPNASPDESAFPADIYPVYMWALTWPRDNSKEGEGLTSADEEGEEVSSNPSLADQKELSPTNTNDDDEKHGDGPAVDTTIRGLGDNLVLGW